MTLPLLVETDVLQKRLDDKNLLIVDLRPVAQFLDGHIRGAVQLDYEHLVISRPPVGGLLPPMEQLTAVAQRIGLQPDKHVVAYDDQGGGRAARLLWTLDALGHAGLTLLNGGYIAWSEEDRPTEGGALNTPPSDYIAQLRNPDVVADQAYIMGRLGASDFAPLDTRTKAEFVGADLRAARGGHIPGARHFDWLEAIDADHAARLRPAAELNAALAKLGISRDQEVVTYCQTHHRSSHTYIVLKHLGFERIRGYHGAWSEWGNNPDTPVET